MEAWKQYAADHFYDMFPVLERGYWYGDYDEQKYRQYRFWHDGLGNKLTLGFTSAHIDSSIAQGRNDAYMKRYGLTYDDIVDPSKLYGETSPLALGVNYVSQNITRLYR